MKRTFTALLLALAMAVGCSNGAVSSIQENTNGTNTDASEPTAKDGDNAKKTTVGNVEDIVAMKRPSLLGASMIKQYEPVNRTLSSYTLNSDLSNLLSTPYQIRDEYGMKQKLVDNLFVVDTNGGSYEFYEVYENNKYSLGASFITTDSLLHTFHLYYAYLQKNVESRYLNEKLLQMSEALYQESCAQFEALRGSEWEEAAARNMDFFAVGIKLAGGEVSLTSRAQEELDNIDRQVMMTSPLFSTAERTYNQDYSQFIPRGYYTESEELKRYFRSMMWYGQMNFSVDQESLNRSAVLAADAIHTSAEDLWNGVYSVTAFFAGESDDNGYCEYYPLVEAAFGSDHTTKDLVGNEKGYELFRIAVENLGAPKINSILVSESEDRDEVTQGFRILGQRFTLDGYIMQRLVYRDLAEADNQRRMMPNALDVPSALGSDTALTILKTTTNVDTWDYTKTVLELREEIESKADELYGSSVRSGWLGTLTPMLETKRDGDPAFTQSDAWSTRKLNTFLGSYTELKHDTVLYDKQVMAEMGAAGMEIPDYDTRGYVETEPEVFSKLAAVSEATVQGLEGYGMISDEDKEYMGILVDMCNRLTVMAEKELQGQLLTDEEYEYIRNFGGELEHFWIKTTGTGSDGYRYRTFERPAAVVVDIATNGDSGTCLEIATGNCMDMYVAVEFDGGIHLCRGPVFSFYQFEQPSSHRLTDEEWRESELYNAEIPDWYNAFAAGYRMGETVSEASTTEETSNGVIGYAYVQVERLNSRSLPSASSEKMGKVDRYSTWPVYEITEAEGYTWYRIDDNRWLADKDSEWIEFTK